MTNPFTDPAAIRSALYATATRIEARSAALNRAKIAGASAAASVADLIGSLPVGAVVLDCGCGPGSLARFLARRYPGASIAAVDQSSALCASTADRLSEHPATWAIQGDFHHLSLRGRTIGAAVAAFSLYHSSDPVSAVAEIGRCLRPSGRLIAATKSLDSYQELDELVANSGLDTGAARRVSLYETFNSANGPAIVTEALDVVDVVHQTHRFRFADVEHLAAYLATSPKYDLAPEIAGNTDRLTQELRSHLAAATFTMSSTVTYIIGRPR